MFLSFRCQSLCGFEKQSSDLQLYESVCLIWRAEGACRGMVRVKERPLGREGLIEGWEETERVEEPERSEED